MGEESREKSVLLLAREEGFFSEAERMDAPSKELDSLLHLDALQEESPLLPREERCWERALLLIRGRGWPSETIRAFFLSEEQLRRAQNLCKEESGAIHLRRPSVFSPTALIIPRSYGQGLSETALTSIIVRQMVYARSLALPQRSEGWMKEEGLSQIGQGVVEIISEDILPAPPEIRFYDSLEAEKAARSLCRQARACSDDLERLSIGEALSFFADKIGCSVEDLPERA